MTIWAVDRSVNYQTKERGRRQGMHEPNAIWAASVHEMGVVIWQESVLDLEVDGNLEGM